MAGVKRRWKWIVIPILAVTCLLFLAMGAFVYWTRHGGGPDAPRVGISVSTLWYDRAQVHRAPYDLALRRAGANVVTIEPQDGESIEKLLDSVDGILLAGGGDVDPKLFGGDPEKSKWVDRERDDFEIDLIRRAEKRGLPVLGICRGCQVLAVSHEGTLTPLEGETADLHGITRKSLSAHDVTVEPGSRLHGIVGGELKGVTSFHAQAVDKPGSQLKVVAWGEDGSVEAVERPGDRFVIGIQWHMELQSLADEDALALFRALVEEARKFRAKRKKGDVEVE